MGSLSWNACMHKQVPPTKSEVAREIYIKIFASSISWCIPFTITWTLSAYVNAYCMHWQRASGEEKPRRANSPFKRVKWMGKKSKYAKMKYACLNCASLEVDCSWNQTTATKWYAVCVCAPFEHLCQHRAKTQINVKRDKSTRNAHFHLFIRISAALLFPPSRWIGDEGEAIGWQTLSIA